MQRSMKKLVVLGDLLLSAMSHLAADALVSEAVSLKSRRRPLKKGLPRGPLHSHLYRLWSRP